MTKVFVGMSGGVDSSVTAALLKHAGYDVTGIFIKGWYPDWLPCSWREDRQDAMRVCALLKIPFQTMDLEQEYKTEVIDYLIEEYINGRTPNPDIMCNKWIKFGAFFHNALAQGADMIATGHYARVRADEANVYHLHTGVDATKDQSYFLWTLTQDILRRTLFPLGGYDKSKTRELAEEFGLPTATKKDSQGICFLGKVDIREFLKHYIETTPGAVLNENGDVIGTHDGAILFTLGQRHGFTVTQKAPDASPHYIVAKDISRNTLTVSEKPYDDTFTVTTAVLRHVNWINRTPQHGELYQARFRYRQKLRSCTFQEVGNGEATITFQESQSAIAPGQSVVIYDGDECVGGGIVSSAT